MEHQINASLPCKRERHNSRDPFALAELKDDDVVGHIPRKILTIFLLELHWKDIV